MVVSGMICIKNKIMNITRSWKTNLIGCIILIAVWVEYQYEIGITPIILGLIGVGFFFVKDFNKKEGFIKNPSSITGQPDPKKEEK